VVNTPVWKEVALWWPEHRTLVVADAVGSAPYYRAPGEPLAVSPVLRGLPPRRLSRLEPEHVLCGHGAGVHGRDAAPALRRALAGSRRRAPAWLLARVRERVGR
jgi:hypothetical protein